VRAIPGVEVVGTIDDLPLTGDRDAESIAIAGRPPKRVNELPVAQVRSVSPDYFRTMRIPLIAGRAFDTRDTSASTAVVLINQAIARRLFPGEDPIGQRVVIWATTAQSRWLTIVGVVGDVRDLGLEEQADLEHVLESVTGDLRGNAIAGMGHTHDQALGLHAVQSVSDRRLRDPQLSRQDVDRDAGAGLDP